MGIAFTVLGLVSVALRSLMLSRHSSRFLAHDVWRYGTGVIYAWLFSGIALLVVLALKQIPLADWIGICIAWMVGLVSVWTIPPYLARKI